MVDFAGRMRTAANWSGRTLCQGPTGRIWYAEGKVKPGLLLPTIPVQAVAVLAHSERARRSGDFVIRHQIQIYLHTDSKTASLVMRMLGDNIPKMAEQGSEQLLMFFSGIAKYAHDKPEKVRRAGSLPPAADRDCYKECQSSSESCADPRIQPEQSLFTVDDSESSLASAFGRTAADNGLASSSRSTSQRRN